MKGPIGGLMLVAWLSLPLTAHAQLPETPRFRTLKVEDGLPSSNVNFIEQDASGYLWFGTTDGLARYDGDSFKVFRHDPGDKDSLPSNAISAMHMDRKGRLWIGFGERGPVHIDPGQATFVQLASGPKNDVVSFESTADGAIWIGTYSQGLFQLSAEGHWRHFTASRSPSNGLPSDEVFDLAVDEAGTLWAGTGRGLVRWNGRRFEPVRLGDLDAPRVVMLEADAEGLWVGTTQGLRLRSPSGAIVTPQFQSGLANPVFATKRDRFGTRWFSTTKGLMKVRNGVLTEVPIGAPHGLAYGKTLLEDAEGGMWVAQRGYGVLYSPASWRRFSTFGPSNSPSEVSVSWVKVIAKSHDGDFWLAGVGGLDKFSLASGSINPVLTAESTSGCTALSLTESSAGLVWIGCTGGLLRFNPSTGAVQKWTERSRIDPLPHGEVVSIVEDKAGIVWINTIEGLQGRDDRGRIVTNLDAKELSPRKGFGPLDLGPDGNVWVDTDSGIARIVGERKRPETVPGLPEIATRRFGFSQEGTLWVLSDESLESFRWNGKRMVLDRHFSGVGAKMAGVGGLVVDTRNRIWFTTARGLFRFDPSDLSMRRYDTEDGLPSSEFSIFPPLVTSNGVVFATTPSDFVVFQPSAFESSAIIPKVQLESISVRRDDRVIDIPVSSTQLKLQADDRDLRIVARIASMSEPRSRRFRFRLSGYDRDWITDEQGERVFTRLEHGNYVMQVGAATADGVWSEPRSLHIEVLPQWWQTVWARLFFALAFVGIILALRSAHRARLRGIHEKQSLEERRALAEQASQAKSRFLADLGHEIRTPMTGVLGMAELMHADASDDRQRARIEAIQSAGRHLLVLLNDALDLARIEAGRLELQDVVFDLPALLVDACALLRPQAEAKRLAFALQLPPDLPRGVRGDPVRLRQILLNLGHNAIKFTAAGRIRICAGALGDTLHVDVEDTGPGMDAVQVARLFGRFEQADGARTAADFGGSGLGLSICRELAQAMRGDIEVDSAPGRGTRFRVTLPLVLQALPEPASLPLRVREPDGEGARVLVVEDDALVGEVVCGLLEHLGHRARHAAHGLEGLAACAEEPFDLVVVDLDLPGIDGFEFAHLLRLQGRAASVVALTARADADAEARARAAGMVDFLRKPVTGEVLAAMVARHARRTAPASA